MNCVCVGEIFSRVSRVYIDIVPQQSELMTILFIKGIQKGHQNDANNTIHTTAIKPLAHVQLSFQLYLC